MIGVQQSFGPPYCLHCERSNACAVHAANASAAFTAIRAARRIESFIVTQIYDASTHTS
jgi:hypothetical protein